jgi:hypothetical protein
LARISGIDEKKIEVPGYCSQVSLSVWVRTDIEVVSVKGLQSSYLERTSSKGKGGKTNDRNKSEIERDKRIGESGLG